MVLGIKRVERVERVGLFEKTVRPVANTTVKVFVAIWGAGHFVGHGLFSNRNRKKDSSN